MWRIAGQQARIEPTARLAEILDGLEPPPWIVARQGALLSPWHRFYLDPLLDWRYRVPPPFWQPREGCRFLLQDEAWQGIPLHVLREAEPGSSGLFLHDFDRCLPEDEVALEVLPVTDGREGEAGGGS